MRSRRIGLFVAIVALGVAFITVRNCARPAAPERAATTLAPSEARAPAKAPAATNIQNNPSLLTPSGIEGKVLAELGAPAQGASVQLTLVAGGETQRATADAQGRFAFQGLKPGSYAIAAHLNARAAIPIPDLPLGAGEELRGLVLQLAQGATLKGTVRDLHSGRGVVSASVRFPALGASSFTDANGAFRMAAIAPGRYFFQVSADGYASRVEPIDLRTPGTDSIDVFLEASAGVQGRVVDRRGEPIGGAKVWAEARRMVAGVGPRPVLARTIAGSTGAFELAAPAGEIELFAEATGRARSAALDLTLSQGEKRQAVELILPNGGGLRGQVLQSDARAANGGQVTIHDLSSGHLVAEVSIDATGQYRAEGLPAGSLVVIADAHRARTTARVQLAEGELRELNLLLGNGTIAGNVVDSANRPIANALVRARPVGLGDLAGRSAVTADDGTFSLSGLDGELFEIAAHSNTAGFGEARAKLGNSSVIVVVGRGGRIQGFVRTSEGKPATDFVVVAEPSEPRPGLRPTTVRGLSPRGDFEIGPIAIGRWDLTASAPGSMPGIVRAVEVESERATGHVEIRLRPARAVCGVVVAEERRPVPNARVGFDFEIMTRPPGSLTARDVVVTDTSGRFCLTVPESARDIFASERGRRGRASLAEGGEVEIALRPGEDSMRGFSGIGLVLNERDGRLFVRSVFENGPAYQAGIRAGDELLAVEGTPVKPKDLPVVIEMIRGEPGTSVSLELVRQGRPWIAVLPRVEVRF